MASWVVRGGLGAPAVGMSNEDTGSRNSEPEVADWYKRPTEMELDGSRGGEREPLLTLPCGKPQHRVTRVLHIRAQCPASPGFQLFRIPSPRATLLFFNLQILRSRACLTKNKLFPWPGHLRIDWQYGSMASCHGLVSKLGSVCFHSIPCTRTSGKKKKNAYGSPCSQMVCFSVNSVRLLLEDIHPEK